VWLTFLLLVSAFARCVIVCGRQDIAAFIKKEFDKKYNPTWHCIVGRNFGSYVTHETKHFIYFYLGQVAILLFKSG
jgi:dynein light chain LC8-type